MNKQKIWCSGGCHCTAVQFRVRLDVSDLIGIECNCSICGKKGFLHCIVEPIDFTLVSGAESLSSYRFNTKVAEHRFCVVCGIHSFYTPRSHPDKVDVNLRCVEGIELEKVPVQKFDGQHWERNIAQLHQEVKKP